MPIVCAAEVFSWYATITTNYIGNACEDSLWAVAVTVLTIGIVLMRPHAAATMRPMLDATIAACALYVAYMVTADAPMYIARWRTDTAAGRPYFHDAALTATFEKFQTSPSLLAGQVARFLT